MSWIWKFLFTVCLAAVVHRATKFVIVSGFFKPQYIHTPGPCQLVNGVDVVHDGKVLLAAVRDREDTLLARQVHYIGISFTTDVNENRSIIEYYLNGSEDIVTLSTGVALISSGFSFSMVALDEEIKGKILSFDFNNPAAGAQEVTIEGGLNRDKFNPLGLSAYEERQKGVVTLFVINRWHEEASVEVFDFKQDTNLLSHTKTIKHINIYTPNNIVATSTTAFYLTNDGYSDWLPIRVLETIMALAGGSVGYHDGQDVRQVVSGLLSPNGIALSHTRKHLYVGSMFGQCIDIYEIQEDASIVFVKSIHLATLVDNLTVDPDTGDVWAACQSNLLAMASQEGRAKGTAQVLRIQLNRSYNTEIREVLMDDGRNLRGSSVASFHQKKLLVGTVTGNMLFCQVHAF